MLNRNENRQMKMHFVTLEELMPQEHFLRDLDRIIDFNFVYDKVEHLYSNTGRPSVDPVVLVKMLLIGYLYGIESERKLEQEIQVNIAYRWFLGIEFDEPVPDHSTISQLRRRKFGGSTLFQDIFDEIVHKCMDEGLVSGKLLLTDSTHIRANADNTKREIIEVPDTPSEYMQKLDREAYEMGLIKEPECPYRQQCINNSKNPRRLERHLHEKARQEQVKNVNTPEYFSAMRMRKIWCEGNFAHQKEQHNLRRTFKRGIEKVTEQCLLSACALNLKRLVKALRRVQISSVFDLIYWILLRIAICIC